jgi:hypothetical protein
MRMILLSALMALGIGLIGAPPTMAGPASGQAIRQALQRCRSSPRCRARGVACAARAAA